MKNLNKKIGAVALASMVVLGGFAASGAQSFADSYYREMELLEESVVKDEFGEKLQSIVGSNHKVSIPYHVEDFFKSAVRDKYGSRNISRSILNLNRIKNLSSSKMFNNLLKSKYNIIMVRFGDKYYAIIKG